MKKTAYLISTVFFSLFLMGMGTTDDSAPVTVPEPEINYAVAMVDRSDVTLDIEKFSCDGELFISGERGNARISIPFDKIASVYFLLKNEELTANVKLKNDTSVMLTVEKDQPCYGTLSYGSIKIEMADIKSITFRDQITEVR
jgi:hypothetical protein